MWKFTNFSVFTSDNFKVIKINLQTEFLINLLTHLIHPFLSNQFRILLSFQSSTKPTNVFLFLPSRIFHTQRILKILKLRKKFKKVKKNTLSAFSNRRHIFCGRFTTNYVISTVISLAHIYSSEYMTWICSWTFDNFLTNSHFAILFGALLTYK